jgi:hypothetical protein
LLLGAGLLFVLTIMFGTVNGQEFCPETFERRRYHYVQLPLVHVQLTGEDDKDISGATEVFVTSQKYFRKKSPANPQWHTITTQRGARAETGDARLLIEYLDAKNSDEYHRWVKWSEDHPKLAAELWPAVQQLAEQRQYLAIPDAFDLAKAADDPATLKQQLDTLLKTRLSKTPPPAKAAK